MAEEKKPLTLQDEDERKRLDEVLERFQTMRTLRSQSYRYFNDRNLHDYLQDSRKRYHSFVELHPEYKADWQARVFMPFTNNKARNVVSQLSGQRVRMEFLDVEKNDALKAKIMQNLYAHTERKENADLVFEQIIEETQKDGTLIGFEGWDNKEKDVKGTLIPIDLFFPGQLHVMDIQETTDCVWVSRISFQEFERDFLDFDDADLVDPGSTRFQENDAFYHDYFPQDFGDDEVFIIRYFNQVKGEFDIIANNVLIRNSKKKTYPWQHKKLPFWKSIHEPFAVNFFYGKSLGAKLQSDQDVANTKWENILDQGKLSAHPPITTTDYDAIPQDMLVPGQLVQRGQETTYDVIPIPQPNEAQYRILELAVNSINLSTADPITQGVSGSREITAKEATIAREAALQNQSLFLRRIEFAMRDRALLRMKNILQFYPRSGKTLRILGEVNEFNDAFGNKQAVREIVEVRPGAGEVTMNEIAEAAKKAGRSEKVTIVPSKRLQDIQFDVYPVALSSVRETKALRLAQLQSVVSQLAQLSPQLLNIRSIAERMVELAGEDKTLVLAEKEQQQAQQQAQQQELQPTQPELSEQMLRTETRDNTLRSLQV